MEVSGKRPDITEEGTVVEQENLCAFCEVDHVITKANGICRECEQLMCDTCFRHHLKVPSCRQHVLEDTYQSLSPVQRNVEIVEKCKRHANEKIKYYCRKHEVVGCGDCMIPGHFACQPKNIKELSKGFQHNEDFKSLMAKLENIMSSNKENQKNVKESQKENKNVLEKALNEITTFRAEIFNYLDRAEASVIKQAKDIERENDKLLTKLEQECKLLSSRITEVRQKLDAGIYQDSALFIQTVDCKPCIFDIERDVSRIQRENDIKTFKFIRDKQLQCMITAAVNLGSIAKPVTTSPTEPDTTTGTKAASNKETTEGKKHADKKDKADESVTGIVVGTRVRPIGSLLRNGIKRHNGETGTVAAVHSKGYLTVMWYATNKTNFCRIGEDVELI